MDPDMANWIRTTVGAVVVFWLAVGAMVAALVALAIFF